MKRAWSDLVQASELQAKMATEDLLILDASLSLSETEPSGAQQFSRAHLPGARFFDLNQHCDARSPFPRMLPPFGELSRSLAQLGAGATTKIVVYDRGPLRSAPRLWWMIRLLGHRHVAVLDGGLAAWERAGAALERGAPSRLESVPEPIVPLGEAALRCVGGEEVARRLSDPGSKIVDARSGARFRGEVQERSPGLGRGHIPGSISFPYAELLDQEGRLISASQIRLALEQRGIDLERHEIVSSCGSGVTACVLAWALEHHFQKTVLVYDASWSEWGRGECGAIETGSGRAAQSLSAEAR